MPAAYYNEREPYRCEVLRERMAAGLIPDGVVDARDVRDVDAGDLRGFGQLHFFAGIGGAAVACRYAGVPDEFSLATAGFPCTDISVAGKGAGLHGDESKLFFECVRLLDGLRGDRPRYLLLENSPALLTRGMGRVLYELAALGYDAEWDCIPASAVGAPHQRDRLWLIAYANGDGVRLESERDREGPRPPEQRDAVALHPRTPRQLADADEGRSEVRGESESRGVESACGHEPNGCGGVREFHDVARREAEEAAQPADADGGHRAERTRRPTGGVGAPDAEPVGPRGAGRALPDSEPNDRADAAAGSLPDADGGRRAQRDARERGQAEPHENGPPISDADGAGFREREWTESAGTEFVTTQPGRAAGGWIPGEWAIEPDFCRVVDGISSRLDRYIWRQRIAALGDAWVPQAAIPALRVILEHAAAHTP